MCKIGLIIPPYLPHRIRGNPKDTRIIQLKKGREGASANKQFGYLVAARWGWRW